MLVLTCMKHVFIKKDVFINLGDDENLVAGEDYDFQRRLIQNNYKLGRVDRITVSLAHKKFESCYKKIILFW